MRVTMVTGVWDNQQPDDLEPGEGAYVTISKTNGIVVGTNHSMSYKPQLNLVMNNVAFAQVVETKLLGVTLDCKLSWSRHIDSVVVKMGRGLSVIKRCSAF